MTYAEWNQILINYYFNESKESEAFLGIEKESFIDYLIDNNIFANKYSEKLTEDPSYDKDLRTYIWDNFTLIFKKKLQRQDNQEYYSKDLLIERFHSYLYNSRGITNKAIKGKIIGFILEPLLL